MIDFSGVKEIFTPDGEVVKITSGSTVLWEKAVAPVLPDVYDYEGEASANYGHILDIEWDDEFNFMTSSLYIIRSSTSDPNIIVKVEGTLATLGDGSTAGVSVEGVRGGRYYIGLTITSNNYYFDGDYIWGVNER